jgi:hypothetical protein
MRLLARLFLSLEERLMHMVLLPQFIGHSGELEPHVTLALIETKVEEGECFSLRNLEFSPTIAPGTQDRFSLMFQLASLLNGDSKIDEPGAIRSILWLITTLCDLVAFRNAMEKALNDDIPSWVRRLTGITH